MISAGLYDAMLDAGFNPPDSAGGDITRFSTNGKTHNKDGWLVVFDDSGACFGCWREGTRFTWSDKSKFDVMSPEDRDVFEFKRRLAIRQAEFNRDQRYNFASSESLAEWQLASVAESHAYLERKGVNACSNLRIGLDGRLIVPVFADSDKIQSLQYIDGDGKKQFKTDGKIKGGFFVVGVIGADCYLCEGLATGLTIHEATGKGVIVAFSASNMPSVYDKLKSGLNITVCADNDAGGVGLKYANECKGAKIVYPATTGTDFNDLGVDATRKFLGVKKDIKKPFLITIEQLLTDIKPIDWLMKGIMERGSIGIMFGESGAGKSLFALDWVCCLANGTDWHGFKVREPKRVVYVCGEGGRGIASRVQAIKQKYGTRIKNNAYFSTKTVDLLNAKSVKQITDSVTDFDIIPDLLVFDTLHKSMTGDENSSKDIAVLFAAIAELQDLYGCAVLIVHHSGLADKMRQRGSSSIKAGVDFEYCISKTNDLELSITCTKMKDYKKMQPLKFIITPTPLEGEQWIDEDGERATSIYLVYEGLDTEKEQKLSKPHENALESLKQALREVGKINKDELLVGGLGNVPVVHKETYRKFFNDTCKGANKARDFDNTLKSLENRRYVGINGDYLWAIEE